MNSPWLRELRNMLDAQIQGEMEVTVQIAVCLASKMPVNQIKDTLGCSEVDIKMAKQRLEYVVGSWNN